MPQLDPAVFATQIFWLAVTFVLLYLILWKAALPKVSDMLEARQYRIDDDLERAAALKEKAATVLAEYEAASAEAQAKARGVVHEALDKMAAEAQKRNDELAQKLLIETREAEAVIAAAKTGAIDNLRGVVRETATAATRKLIGVEVSQEQVERAVDAAVGGR